jgi:hypothetical protein
MSTLYFERNKKNPKVTFSKVFLFGRYLNSQNIITPTPPDMYIRQELVE